MPHDKVICSTCNCKWWRWARTGAVCPQCPGSDYQIIPPRISGIRNMVPTPWVSLGEIPKQTTAIPRAEDHSWGCLRHSRSAQERRLPREDGISARTLREAEEFTGQSRQVEERACQEVDRAWAKGWREEIVPSVQETASKLVLLGHKVRERMQGDRCSSSVTLLSYLSPGLRHHKGQGPCYSLA